MKPVIEKGDVIEWAKNYQGPKFHAILCDPPYHLQSIVNRFGKEDSAPAQYGDDGAFSRASAGFMGKTWDGGDVAFDPETWKLIKKHLYPGAFGMAFASSRGWHRLAVAIEDAGLIIHPTIFLWTQSQGFPKATRIDNQIDRALGKEDERKVVGKREHPTLKDKSKVDRQGITQYHADNPLTDEWDIIEPATELAQAWAGHRYGLQALKPVCEPIILFQKPYEGRPVENMMETGAGGLNIDAGRIGTDDSISGSGKGFLDGKGFGNIGYGEKTSSNIPQNSKGRWPTNFALVHHPECRIIGEIDDSYQINRFTDGAKPFGNGAGHDFESEEIENKQYEWACHPDCPSRLLGEQAGERKSGKLEDYHTVNADWGYHGGERNSMNSAGTYGDSGSANRFYYQANWSYEILEQLENADPVYYCPKVSKAERNAGLEYFEPKRSDYRPNDPDENSLRTRLHKSVPRKNHHPTLKPIELMRYLATLLLPPDIYAPDRRILVPFAGVASEMIGCMLAGWDIVLGIELDEEDEYIDIANARIDWWHKWHELGYTDPKEILKIRPKEKSENQLEMF